MRVILVIMSLLTSASAGVAGIGNFGVDGALGSGLGSVGGGLQVGTAQVSVRDRAAARAKEQRELQSKKFNNADAGAGRYDKQERQDHLSKSAFNKKDNQVQGAGSQESRSYNKNLDHFAEKGQRQKDFNDKHDENFESVGRSNRQDAAGNSGDKSLAARKSVFTHQNNGLENVDYGFKKDFDTNFNERGGFKESVGKDNNNLNVYEENQHDNRFSKGELDAFKRSNDNAGLQKRSDWLSGAAQKKNTNGQYAAADNLKNYAGQKNVDWNTLFDRRGDVFWHHDNAQDKALRQANDVAQSRADQNKNALSQASGSKGLANDKYYGGENFGHGHYPNTAYSTGASGVVAETGRGPYGQPIQGPDVGPGVVYGGDDIAGTRVTGPGVKGHTQGSGGDFLKRVNENARQSDLANEQLASQAQSDATALNDYHRGRGLNDSLEVKGQKEGLWAKDRAGHRDAKSQSFDGASANAAKEAKLAGNALAAEHSSSNLDGANKNYQAKELDRLNYKKNLVDNDQKVRKQKQFYHDKNEDGYNNEALKYNRNKGNQDKGEQQQALKEARDHYNSAADDAKINQQGRAFHDFDSRRLADSSALHKQKDNSGGSLDENRQASAKALKDKASFDSGQQSGEFDKFAQNINNHNQQLWDKTRKDAAGRDQSSDKIHTLGAGFRFAPQIQNKAFSLGGNSGGSDKFGTAFGSGRGTFGYGSSSGGGHGVAQQGTYDSNGSGSPGGSFINDIGASSFGQSDFRGSSGSGNTARASYGGPVENPVPIDGYGGRNRW